MAFNREQLLGQVGRRLKKLRKQTGVSLIDMGKKLELSQSGYSKNENGMTFPKLKTMYRLQVNFDISMDWLLFDRGPVHLSEREPKPEPRVEVVDKKRTIDLDDVSPDIGELLEYMARDRLLKHEVLSYFYKYKEKREGRISPEPPSTPTDDS